MEFLKDINNAFLPEFIIILLIFLNIILALSINKNTLKKAKIINITGFLISFISMVFIQISPAYYAFNNMFVSNLYTTIFKIMILFSALLVIISSSKIIREKRRKSFEYFTIINTSILGAFSLVSSNDFLTAFISLEILSVSCYMLSGFRRNHKSKEASLKYLITGSIASSLILFGISYLYGITGQINFTTISDIVINQSVNPIFIFASLLIISGLMFKLGCIPFTNWIIDIYDGSGYNIGFYISLIPKIAATGFIAKLFYFIFQYIPSLQITTAIIAIITIIYGSIGAIKQTNIKRIYAYSSVIHSGFILIAISISSIYAISSAIFYLFTYIFMNAGIWLTSMIFNNNYNSDELDTYKGLFYKHPYFSSAFIICLISLAGLPPTGGFISKLYLYTAISRVNTTYIIFLLIVLFATIIALCIYLKIIKILFEKQSVNICLTNKFNNYKFILYLYALITILICIFPDYIIKLSQICAYYI